VAPQIRAYQMLLPLAVFLSFSCENKASPPTEKMLYVVGSQMGILDLSSGEDRLLFRYPDQTLDDIEYFDQDTILVTASGDPRGLLYVSLRTRKQKMCLPVFPIMNPKWFSSARTLVYYSVESGQYSINAMHFENVRPQNALRLHSWSAGAPQEIHLRYPELARVSDSTFAFDDPSNALFVCNVESDSVTDTGLRGFRPMSFRTATNQLICSDVQHEYLYLVDLERKAYEDVGVKEFVGNLIYVKSVDGLLFLRYRRDSLIEQTDLILYRFGDNSEEIIAEKFSFTSALLLSQPYVDQYVLR